jgi:uncharacterized protein (DUF1697 family)
MTRYVALLRGINVGGRTNGYGRSKLSNAFLEERLGVAATTRNWKTVGRLRDLASSAVEGA